MKWQALIMNFMDFVFKCLSCVNDQKKSRVDAYHYENLEGTQIEQAGESYQDLY